MDHLKKKEPHKRPRSVSSPVADSALTKRLVSVKSSRFLRRARAQKTNTLILLNLVNTPPAWKPRRVPSYFFLLLRFLGLRSIFRYQIQGWPGRAGSRGPAISQHSLKNLKKVRNRREKKGEKSENRSKRREINTRCHLSVGHCAPRHVLSMW